MCALFVKLKPLSRRFPHGDEGTLLTTLERAKRAHHLFGDLDLGRTVISASAMQRHFIRRSDWKHE